MTSWIVWYDSWQMECCGTPFAVGEEVSLPLMIRPRASLTGAVAWQGRLSTVAGPVRTVGRGEDRVAVVRADDGLEAALHGPYRQPPARVEVTGLLSVERHTATWPQTVARVRAVHISTRRSASAVPGEPEVRAADRCPKWFADDGDRREEGAFVTLDLPVAAPRTHRGQ